MRVRTIRTHGNPHGMRDGIPFEKRNGRVYEAPDAAAKNLIAAGYVEAADKKHGDNE